MYDVEFDGCGYIKEDDYYDNDKMDLINALPREYKTKLHDQMRQEYQGDD